MEPVTERPFPHPRFQERGAPEPTVTRQQRTRHRIPPGPCAHRGDEPWEAEVKTPRDLCPPPPNPDPQGGSGS